MKRHQEGFREKKEEGGREERREKEHKTMAEKKICNDEFSQKREEKE